jgi:hypothetical protein
MVRRTYFVVIALVMAWIGFASLPTAAQTGRTFFIDYGNGSNSNNGTSKNTPWKTHPYMQTGSNCTGGTTGWNGWTHQAGDSFIFKGGVTWPVACFQMSIPAGGTASASDYYGVDKAWFAGGSWVRPKFDMAQNVPTGRHVIIASGAFPGYTTFDGFEIANQQVPLGQPDIDDAYNFAYIGGRIPGVLVENGYIHDWVSNTNVAAQSGSFAWPYSAGAIDDGSDRITVDHMTVSGAGSWVYNGGTKVTGGYSGGCVNCGTVSNSTFHDVGAACFTVVSCHDNEFYNVKQSSYDICPCRPHSQVIEDDMPSGSDPGGWMYVYNNYIHDNPNVGVSIYVPYNMNVFNNVLRNTHQDIVLTTIANDSSGTTGYIYNNTIDCSDGNHCLARDAKGSTLGTVYATNNIFITNGTPTCFSGSCSTTALVQLSNYTMSTSEAGSYGFTSATKYAPTSSNSRVTSAGTNLSNKCSSGLALLCQDAQGAAWYGGNYQTRPLDSTAWTLGAYVFGGQSQSSTPNPPTNLTASVQ